MSSLKLFGTELKSLKNKKGTLIALIGVMLIPIVYCAVLLSSTWGPYDNLDNLPVAVVNNDAGAVSDGKPINVGNDLVETLKSSNTLGWKFVTDEEAKKGLEENKYYMVVEIPEDFSQKVTTVLTANPVEPELKYIQNEGLNFMGSQVTNSAVERLREQLGDKITATYATTLLSKFGDVGTGFGKAADGSNQIYDGTVTLSNGTNTLLSSLTEKAPDIAKLANGAVTADQGASKLLSSVQGGTGDINKLASGSGQVLGGLNSLDSGLGTIGNGVNQLSAGVKTLPNAFANQFAPVYSSQFAGQFAPAFTNGFVNGQGSTPGFAASLENGVNAVSSGVATSVNGGFDQFRTQVGTGIEGGFQQYNAGVQSGVNGGVTQLKAGISKGVSDGIASYSAGVEEKIAAGLPTYKAGVNSGVNGGIAEYKTALNNGFTQFKAGVMADTSGAGTIAQGAAQTVTQIITGLSQANIGLTPEQLQAIQGAVTNGIGQFGNTVATTVKTGVLNAVETQLVPGYVAGADTLATKLNAGLDAGADQFVTTLQAGLADGTSQLQTGLIAGLSGGADTLETQLVTNLQAGANQVKDGIIPAINTGSQTLQSGIVSGVDGALKTQLQPQLIDGLEKGLGTNLNTALTSNIKTSLQPALSTNLATGIKPIIEGFDGNASSPGLVKGVASASNGVDTLINGQSQIAAGTKKLVTSWGTLTNGAAALKDGLGQISDGTATVNTGWGTLTEGATALDEGANKLKDGSQTLASSLEDGAEQVNGLSVTDKNIAMFATPVKTVGEKVNSYTYYRDSTAPYILSLALFVGMLVLSFFVDFKKPAILPGSAISWFLSKWLQLALFATIQAVLVTLFTLFVLGLDVENSGLFILFGIFVSLTFMSIIFFLVTAGGNIGRFLALVFIVLQLSLTGSNLPIPMLPENLRSLSEYLPLTYSNAGFKSVISLGDTSLLSSNAGVLAIWLVVTTVLALITFVLSYRTLRTSNTTISEA